MLKLGLEISFGRMFGQLWYLRAPHCKQLAAKTSFEPCLIIFVLSGMLVSRRWADADPSRVPLLDDSQTLTTSLRNEENRIWGSAYPNLTSRVHPKHCFAPL